MSNEEKKGAVNAVLKTCLNYLVEIGFATPQSFQGKVINTRCDMNERLVAGGIHAAASIDDKGCPVVIYNIEQKMSELACAIAHESIHIAQICKGDWEPYEGYSEWKGNRYKNLTASNPDYYSADHQPWEAEVYDLEQKVIDYLFEKLPSLANM